ncbi:MAG: DUF2905 domain-containing protein [Candidatus Scalinduaceae bacterium]
MADFGRLFIFIGILLVVIGFFLILGNKIPFIGKLPGDISIEKNNFSFYFPITTCIIISIILSLIFWFFSKR